VPARLPALGDDDVDATLGCVLRLGGAAGRERGDRTGSMDDIEVRRGIAPEERDDPDTRSEGDLDAFVLRLADDQVDPERPVGRRSNLGDRDPLLVGRHPRLGHHPEAAGRGHRCREGRHGEAADRRLDDRVVDADEPRRRRLHQSCSRSVIALRARRGR
jgi:hypothetical protein